MTVPRKQSPPPRTVEPPAVVYGEGPTDRPHGLIEGEWVPGWWYAERRVLARLATETARLGDPRAAARSLFARKDTDHV